MKKLVALLLCVIMATAMFASCDDSSTDTSSAPASQSDVTSQTESSDQSSDISEEVSETINYLDRIYTGDKYAGRTFVMFTSGVNPTANSEIVFNEGLQDSDNFPEAVNEAIKRRNTAVEELLGVNIEEIYFHDSGRYNGKTISYIRNATLGEGTPFNAASICLYDCGTLAMDGYLHDLTSLENFNRDNPWWEQVFNQTSDIAGSQYFVLGDLMVGYKSSLPCIYYNKDLFESLGLEDPQQLAIDGEWTIDKAIELSTSYNDDINGTPGIQWDDCYGWAGQHDDMFAMLYGAGVRILSQDSEGYPYLSLWSETANNVVEKVLELMLNPSYYMSGNDLFGSTPYEWPMQALEANFVAGNVLFYSGSIGTAVSLSGMEDTFAIVPVPKFSADQDDYFSLLNTWTTNAICIPTNNSEEDAEFAAAVLEAMAYYSWEGHADSMAVAYLERVIKMQRLQGDEDSLKILDIIFNSAGMEMGSVFQVGNISGSKNVNTVLGELISGKKIGQFRSTYEAHENVFKNDAEAIAEFFRTRG